MKKLSLIAAALLLAAGNTFAVDATDQFSVSVTLTSSCSVTTAATDLAFTYSALDPLGATGSTRTVFSCTRGLTAPTFQFDNGAAGEQTGSAAASTGTITAQGVIKGLLYTLTAAVPAVTGGTAASAGVAGTGGTGGTADTYTVSISGSIAAGQAGDASDGSSHTRVLTITY
jgi:hypothetical protein